MTAKQKYFVREFISGRSQTAAYRAAYCTENMKENTIRREASRLMSNPNITTTIYALEAQADAAALSERVASKEEVLTQLTHYMQHGQTGDAVRVKAAELLGKHYGLFLDKVAVEEPERTSDEIRAQLMTVLENLNAPDIQI